MNTRSVPMQFSQPDPGLNLDSGPPARYVRFGSYDLDLQRQELYRDGLRVPLPRKVFEVLLVLIEKPGAIVTREALRARLWPPDSRVNYNANVNTTVNKLRQVLGDSTNQPTFVETIPRRGYSFIAKTQFADEPCAREERPYLAASSGSLKPVSPANRQSTWFVIRVAALLLVGILLGALTAYLAFYR
jgi:DNA-binding winged helix-turn-helix (wHTH) protein